MKQVLQQRQFDLTVVMDRVHKPHNLAAIARSADSVGIHKIHAISEKHQIRLTQKAATGVKKWLEMEVFQNPAAAIEPLLQKGYQIIAADLDSNAIDYRQADYTRPTAILVGSELEGLSPQAKAFASQSVTIPLMGMVQSLNVSVATALILNEAMYQRRENGQYQSSGLDQETIDKILFEWCYPKIVRHCKKHQLPYPKLDENGYIITEHHLRAYLQKQDNCTT